MRHLVGWVWLAVCMCGLDADLIAHLKIPIREIFMDPCVFPFMYGEVVYHSCTAVHSDFDWCSLDAIFHGRWRYCTAIDPPTCIFPFKFKKILFGNCTKQDYVLNRSWCSLTKDYDKDRKWKQCSPLNF